MFALIFCTWWGYRCNPRKFLENPMYISHVGKSMYALQLERWFTLFGRENFKVGAKNILPHTSRRTFCQILCIVVVSCFVTWTEKTPRSRTQHPTVAACFFVSVRGAFLAFRGFLELLNLIPSTRIPVGCPISTQSLFGAWCTHFQENVNLFYQLCFGRFVGDSTRISNAVAVSGLLDQLLEAKTRAPVCFVCARVFIISSPKTVTRQARVQRLVGLA